MVMMVERNTRIIIRIEEIIENYGKLNNNNINKFYTEYSAV